MRDFRSSRSQNLTATFFPTFSATSRASHCSLKMEKTVYLFWIMHPTTQMGVLSKRELKNFSSIHMPRLSGSLLGKICQNPLNSYFQMGLPPPPKIAQFFQNIKHYEHKLPIECRCWLFMLLFLWSFYTKAKAFTRPICSVMGSPISYTLSTAIILRKNLIVP